MLVLGLMLVYFGVQLIVIKFICEFQQKEKDVEVNQLAHVPMACDYGMNDVMMMTQLGTWNLKMAA
jgi:hypothetical protein